MFANFGKYSIFILKREKIMSAVWAAALVLFTAGIAAYYPGMFPDETALMGMAATMNTPAMTAMMGPVYGLESLSVSIVMAQECLIWVAIAVILMNIFFINRYTRADEELGRLEMFTALPVGRLTNSAAAVVFAFVLNMLIAAVIALPLILINIDGNTARGAFAYGLSIGMQGFVFAALTLLMAQLFSTARGVMSASVALMGLAYVLRAQGDMAGNDLSVISPMGLGLQVQAFYTSDFWPVAVLFVEAAAVAVIAMVINARRDVGMGVFPARKGRGSASAFLRSPLGFAWRLSRGSFYAWGAGLFLIGMSYGMVTGELTAFADSNEMMTQVISGMGADLADGFVTLLSGIMAIMMSVPLMGCVTRMAAEEKRGRMELVLSAAVPRVKLYGSFVLVACLEAVILALLSVFGFCSTALSSGLVTFETVLNAMLVYIPALLVMTGLAAFLVGWLPKLTALVWIAFCGAFILFFFGRIIDMPEMVLRLSPFGNTPQYPVQEVTAMPLVVMCAVAGLLMAVGAVGYKKRDI